MSDYAYRLTANQLSELEDRIREFYSEAAKEQRKIAEDYFSQFKQRDAEQRYLLEEGKITEEYYKQWRLAQIGRGERFERMRDELAERATAANEVAIAYVNDLTPSIYTLNLNYAAYTIENHAGNVGFTLFNEDAVRRLIVEQPDIMPYYPPQRAVNRGIDLAYGKKQITSVVTSSILQGMSIDHIAEHLQERITDMGTTSAIRAARTAITNAQNGGRQQQFEQAKKMGIRVKKRWRCIHDARTRPEHGEADGQIKEVEEPYEVGGEELMFPADTSGSGWNVYNCRCRSENYLPDYPRDMGETYTEWINRKEHETDDNKTMFRRDQIIPNVNFRQISDSMFNSLVAGAKAQGATIIRGTQWAEEHLGNKRAGSIGDILIFKKEVCKSDVHEELRHFWQYRSGYLAEIKDPIEKDLKSEIDAKKYLLFNKKKFKIPNTETLETEAELKYYEKLLEEHFNGKQIDY